jgi:uncharacterized protein (TIGR02118 family)
MRKRTIVLYGRPDDPAAFDRYYAEVHTPLALAMPHLRELIVSRGDVTVMGDRAEPWHLVAQLVYDSQADMEAALASPAGQAAVADVANFATGGATFVVIDEEPVLTTPR